MSVSPSSDTGPLKVRLLPKLAPSIELLAIVIWPPSPTVRFPAERLDSSVARLKVAPSAVGIQPAIAHVTLLSLPVLEIVIVNGPTAAALGAAHSITAANSPSAGK